MTVKLGALMRAAWLARLFGGLRAFGRESRGNVAMMFGLALPLLVMMSLGAIDIHQASRVKANLQDALDAAALAAARSSYSDAASIQRLGLDALKANMPGYFADGGGDTATFVLDGNTLVADARVQVKVLVANIILPPYGQLLDDYLPVSGHSEVLRASRNVEVGLALDVTLSMEGSPLAALKEAATELVKIVVQDQQLPFYSKIGIAPYGAGVNLGTRAEAARGKIRGPVAINDARWTTGTAKSISGITKAYEGVVSAPSHGFSDGDAVVITGVRGMTQINGYAYSVIRVDADRFKVRRHGQSKPLDTRNFSTYTSSGQIRKCLVTDCSAVVTAPYHGLQNGDYVWIDEVRGMTGLNRSYLRVGDVTADSFSTGILGYNLGTYSSNGRVWCTSLGCERYRFTNKQNTQSVLFASNCVSERIGSEAYTDAPPSSAPVGYNYPSTRAACPDSVTTPLSSSRPDLIAAIDSLQVEGTTAGQIGVAWGWYLVSPRFASFWGGTGAPAPHDTDKTLKVVVLMTDGEFNTPYCDGVVASDAEIGSYVGNTNLIRCPASNGDPFTQAVRLCNAMKAQDIVVYTVGFNLNSSRGGSGVDTAIEVMETCATDKATHFHDTRSGADLKEAFKAIGRDITRLRISR